MSTTTKVWIACFVALIIQGLFFWAMYDQYKEDVLSIHEYQTLEDQNHNKTTQDLQICQAEAVINHAVNWKRMCAAYGLPESCGLPAKDYAFLAENLKSEDRTCLANHQYQIPSRVGPSMDDEGHLLP